MTAKRVDADCEGKSELQAELVQILIFSLDNLPKHVFVDHS